MQGARLQSLVREPIPHPATELQNLQTLQAAIMTWHSQINTYFLKDKHDVQQPGYPSICRNALVQPIPAWRGGRVPTGTPREKACGAVANEVTFGAHSASLWMKTWVPDGLGFHLWQTGIAPIRIYGIWDGEIFLEVKNYISACNIFV